MTLPFYNSFFQTTNVPAVQLATKLAALAPKVGGRSFEHVFFSSSGSESNDTNVRMVRRYWDLLGQPQRKVIISRMNAYHGSTMAGASLGGMSGMHAQGDLPIADITHIGQPYFFENALPGESQDAFGLRAAGWLETKILVKSLQALPGTEFSVTKLTPDVAVANLIEGLTVEETAVSSGVIEVAYKGSGRAMVARIVDALVESHHAEHSAALREDSERSLEFLNKQLPTIAAQLQEAQAALSKYQQINGGLSVDFDGQLLLRNGVDLESKRLELLTQIDKEKTRYTAEHPVVQALAA
eukprot:gene12877-17154_t